MNTSRHGIAHDVSAALERRVGHVDAGLRVGGNALQKDSSVKGSGGDGDELSIAAYVAQIYRHEIAVECCEASSHMPRSWTSMEKKAALDAAW